MHMRVGSSVALVLMGAFGCGNAPSGEQSAAATAPPPAVPVATPEPPPAAPPPAAPPPPEPVAAPSPPATPPVVAADPVERTGPGARVTETFAMSKSVYAVDEKIEVIHTMTNPADAPPLFRDSWASTIPRAHIFEFGYEVSRDGQIMTDGSSIGGNRLSHVTLFNPGQQIVTPLELERAGRRWPPGHYRVRVGHTANFAVPRGNPRTSSGNFTPEGRQSYSAELEFEIREASPQPSTTQHVLAEPARTGPGERVTGTFTVAKSVFARGEPIEILYTLHNPSDAPALFRDAWASDGIHRFELGFAVSRNGVAPAEPGRIGGGFGGNRLSVVKRFEPGASVTQRIDLSSLGHDLSAPGHYVVRCTHEAHFAPARGDVSNADLAEISRGGKQVYESIVEFDVR